MISEMNVVEDILNGVQWYILQYLSVAFLPDST